MELETNKIDQTVLALLALGRHEGYRAWKSFDWESMGRLHQKGYITGPVRKAKSVLFTEDGAWGRGSGFVRAYGPNGTADPPIARTAAPDDRRALARAAYRGFHGPRPHHLGRQ